jgi:hypothetical protein
MYFPLEDRQTNILPRDFTNDAVSAPWTDLLGSLASVAAATLVSTSVVCLRYYHETMMSGRVMPFSGARSGSR